METIKDRLNAVIQEKNLSVRSFERLIGASNGYIKNIKGGINTDKAEDILHAFPDLNPTWLLTGEGEMLLPDEEDKYRKKPDIPAIEPPEVMKLQDRLSDVLNYTGLNRSALAQKIGVKAYKLQDISRGQTVRMPSDVLNGLSREFPDLNPTWLLTGEGEMLLPDEEDNRLEQLTAGNASGVKERLKEYIKYSGITTTEFERTIGASNGYVTSISKGIGAKFSREISKNYPDLNLDWLLTGEGEMLLPDEEDKYRKRPNLPVIEAPDGMELTPENSVTYHPDLLVTGGDVDTLSGDELSTAQLYIPGYEGCHAIQAVGHSMYPTIASGDIVICKRYTDRFVVNGDIYVVNTHDQALVKRVIAHNAPDPEDSYFELRSDNPKTDLYVPMRVRGEDVTSLYKVLAIIRRL